ncbi:hypothetical protein BRADI_2g31083v3, partial [Brachypodium distachyon]
SLGAASSSFPSPAGAAADPPRDHAPPPPIPTTRPRIPIATRRRCRSPPETSRAARDTPPSRPVGTQTPRGPRPRRAVVTPVHPPPRVPMAPSTARRSGPAPARHRLPLLHRPPILPGRELMDTSRPRPDLQRLAGSDRWLLCNW